MRCAISSGCSIKFDFDSITPGMIVLPSGSLTRSNRVHSCAWRGLAASNEIVAARAANAIFLWESSGRPEGQSLSNWLQAEREFEKNKFNPSNEDRRIAQENEVLLIRGFIQHVTLPLILNSTPAPI